ncbi:MAG: hypothetical protein AABZ08_05775 [Planctomycetota bacterium]
MTTLARIHVALTTLCLLCGCAGAKNAGVAKGPPPRAPELDALDAWLGEWDVTGQVREIGTGRTMQAKGHESVRWSCDKQFLVEETTWGGDTPESMETAMTVRTWNPHAKVYRSWYFSSHGTVGHSKMTYDSATKTWRAQTKNVDPETCEPVRGEMVIKLTDPATMDWTYDEWDGLKLKKLVEMKGVSKRR